MASTIKCVKHSTFISKLWDIVNDATKKDAIGWSKSGESFTIYTSNPYQWNILLLTYFKHNNMSSFIRQLNMYGFKKISENGTREKERTEARFFHTHFQRGHPELLGHIVRKQQSSTTTKSTVKEESSSEAVDSAAPLPVPVQELNRVLSDVSVLRDRQENVDQQLATIKNENAALWHELTLLRNKHSRQSQIVNKLIQFLMTVVQPNTRMGVPVKRKYPLMINDSPAKARRTDNSDGPTIHELHSDSHVDDTNLNVASESKFHVQSPKNSPGGGASAAAAAAAAEEFAEEVPSDEQLVQLLSEAPEGDKVAENENEMAVDELFNMDMSNPADEFRDINDIMNEQQFEMAADSADSGLNNLIAGKYNTNILANKCITRQHEPSTNNDSDPSLAVAPIKPELKRLNSLHDFNHHVSSTQSELESIKDLLSANNVDATHLLGLFNGEFQIPNPDPFASSELSCYGDFYAMEAQQQQLQQLQVPPGTMSDSLVSSGGDGGDDLLNELFALVDSLSDSALLCDDMSQSVPSCNSEAASNVTETDCTDNSTNALHCCVDGFSTNTNSMDPLYSSSDHGYYLSQFSLDDNAHVQNEFAFEWCPDPVLTNQLSDTLDLQQLFDEEDASPLPETLLEVLVDESYNECPSLETPQVELRNNEFSYGPSSPKNAN